MAETLTPGGKPAGDNAQPVPVNKPTQGHRVSLAQSPEKQDETQHFPQILGISQKNPKPRFPSCSNRESNMPRGQEKFCAVAVHLVPSLLTATDGGTQ